MKKLNERHAEKMDCVVNASCIVRVDEFQYGAGTELSLPYDLAVQLGKEGKVTLLVPNNPIPEET